MKKLLVYMNCKVGVVNDLPVDNVYFTPKMPEVMTVDKKMKIFKRLKMLS